MAPPAVVVDRDPRPHRGLQGGRKPCAVTLRRRRRRRQPIMHAGAAPGGPDVSLSITPMP